MDNDPNIIRFPSKRSLKIKCARTTKAGTPCRNWAVTGSNACQAHLGVGTVRQQGLEKAEERKEISRDLIVQRLYELVEPSVERLKAIITTDLAPGMRVTDQLRAIEIVMDRTVGKKIEVGVEDTDEKDLDDEIEEAFGVVLGATGSEDAAAEEWLGEDDDHDDD